MWCDPVIFSLCEALKTAGREPVFAPGRRLARGFADLGHEEFVMLPSGKLMSLFSGAVAPLPEEHRKFFFEIPTLTHITEEIEAHGGQLLNINRIDARSWTVTARDANGATIEHNSASIDAAAILCLIDIYKARHVSAA